MRNNKTQGSCSQGKHSLIKVDDQRRNTPDHTGKIHLKLRYRTFPDAQLPASLNTIVYGCSVGIYQRKNLEYVCEGNYIIYLDTDSNEKLHIQPTKQPKNQFLLWTVNIFDLSQISSVILPIPLCFKNSQLDCLIQVALAGENDTTQQFILQFDCSLHRDHIQHSLQHLLIILTYELQFSNQLSFLSYQVSSLIEENNYGNELNANQIQTILNTLDFNIPNEAVQQLFFLGNRKGNFFINLCNQLAISLAEFKFKIPLLLIRNDIMPIFEKYCKQSQKIQDQNKGCMTIEEFRNFLQTEQNLKPSKEEFLQIVANLLEDKRLDLTYQLISFSQFSKYLSSYENTIEDLQTEANQDMDQELSHYHICTSRQTFQVSQSLSLFHCLKKYNNQALQPLIFALERGSKYIEISIWDGEFEPICFYGPMMNFQITLKLILEAIKEYAFIKSQYPLIVMFDDHCSKSKRKQINEIISVIFKDNEIVCSDSDQEELLTPSQMKNKIILCKRTTTPSERDVEECSLTEEEAELIYTQVKKDNLKLMQLNNKVFGSAKLKQQLDNQQSNTQREQIEQYESSMLVSVKKASIQFDKNFYLYQIIQDQFEFLNSNRIIYQVTDWINIVAYEINQFEDNPPQQQRQIDKSVNYLKYCTQGRIITYSPLCKPTDCKNSYTSQVFFISYINNKGFLCQMSLIMVHHHIIDYNYMYNYAMFKQNGGVGYILKNCFKKDQQQPKRKISFTVISGSQLGDQYRNKNQVTSPLVQIIYREPTYDNEDLVQQKCSKIVKNNSFNPLFNLNLDIDITNQEFGVLMVCIYNRTLENLIFWNSYTINSLRSGYRIFPLLDENLNPQPKSRIFCKLQVLE